MLNKSDHGFRYYTSDNRRPIGGPRTNTQPGPTRKAAESARDAVGIERSTRPGSSRVRVAAGAGDKCVPPAKSKPKKRKAVREGEGPSIGMECVAWSEERYGVGQLVSAFGHRLPVIAKVCVGCSGDLGSELHSDQVLQVHSFGRQKRIKARYVKGKGGKLSIPLDYPMEIYTKEGSTGERWKLMQAMEVKRLPLKAQVLSTYGAEDNVHLAGEEFEFRKVEEDVFLRANHIEDGWIDQSNVSLIPANASAQFSIAVGMRNASGSEWEDYFGMFARSVRHFKFDLLTGYPGVIMEDALASARLSLAQLGTPEPAPSPAVYANITELKESEKAKVVIEEQTPNVYENLPKEEKKEESPFVAHYKVEDSTYAHADRRISQKKKPEELTSPVSPPPPPVPVKSEPLSPRSDTPFSEMDGEDLQEMFLSVVSLVQEEDKLEEERQRSLQRGEATEHRVVVETHQVPTQSYTNPAFQSDDFEKPRLRKVPPRVEKKPSKGGKHQLNVELKNVRNQPSETFSHTAGSSSEDPNARVVINRKSDHPPPRAVVQPTVKEPAPLVTGNIVQVIITEKDPVDRRTSALQIEAMEDVPEILDGLTVTDVCQCLRLLNMDPHVKHFQKHQVDGGLLADMKEKVLTDEFKFTPFNASKLMRFVRGWRPKLV